MNEAMLAQLTDGLRQMGLDASRPGVPKVAEYIARMLEKNRVMNLSAIREPEAAVRLHALDALSIFGCLDLAGKQVLDVGTGGGVPGALLALYEPDAHVSMLDSTAKKLAFVEDCCRDLGAAADFYAVRAEELAQGEKRESFDVVTARAVAALPALCEICMPFVKVGGVFAAYKANAAEELAAAEKAIQVLGGRALKPFAYKIPGEAAARCILLIEKIAPTPAQYPRAWAKIKSRPL